MVKVSDNSALRICKSLVSNIHKICKEDNSLKFFRKDFNSRTVWLHILKAHFENEKINIEQLSRSIASMSTVSKPTLRLILDNAEHRGFLRFVKSKEDQRSVNIQLEEVTIKEFKDWCNDRSEWFKI